MTAPVKLAAGVAIVVGVTLYMAYVGASSSWKYYLTAEEYAAGEARFVGQRLRVSGRVAENTLQKDASSKQTTFALAAGAKQVRVKCCCEVPENLDEGRDVVVEGRADARGVLVGEKVLTKCASKYESESRSPQLATRPREVR